MTDWEPPPRADPPEVALPRPGATERAGSGTDASGTPAGDPPTRQQPRWRVRDGLIGWALGFVSAILVTGIYAGVTGVEEFTFGMFVWSQAAQWSAILAWLTFLDRRQADANAADGLTRARRFGLAFRSEDVPLGVISGIVGSVVIGLVLDRLYRLIDPDVAERVGQSTRELADQAEGGLAIVLALFVIVGAPLIEELLFRGVLQPALLRRFRPAVAIVLSSAFFALAHLQLLEFPGLFLIGALFGTLAYWSGRLGPAIVCHMAFNAFAVVALLRG